MTAWKIKQKKNVIITRRKSTTPRGRCNCQSHRVTNQNMDLYVDLHLGEKASEHSCIINTSTWASQIQLRQHRTSRLTMQSSLLFFCTRLGWGQGSTKLGTDKWTKLEWAACQNSSICDTDSRGQAGGAMRHPQCRTLSQDPHQFGAVARTKRNKS